MDNAKHNKIFQIALIRALLLFKEAQILLLSF